MALEETTRRSSFFGTYEQVAHQIIEWIDEEAALYAVIQLENKKVVTKFISEINFVSSAKQGDIIEIGIEVSSFGSTSLTLRCDVRNKMTHQTIITVDKIVMVNLVCGS